MKSAVVRTVLLSSCLFLLFATALQAAPQTMTATGEYIMGDNDTFIEAKKLALQEAKRMILEKAGTYIESTTQVKDFVVKSEEIKLYTAGIIKIEEAKEERGLIENKASVLKVTVRAVVDPDVVVKQIVAMRNKRDIEEKSKKIASENSKLRKEIEQLNQQLRNSVNESKFRDLRKQREQILDRIQENEKGLTILISEGSLHQAALFDRQKREDDMQVIRNFFKEVAAAYSINYSDPEIDDNGDGTACARIPVSIKLPGIFGVKGSEVDVGSMEKFSKTGLIIRGYSDGGLSFICSDSINKKKCNNTLKPFVDRELQKFRIEVKLGNFVARDSLAVSSVLDSRPKYQSQTYYARTSPSTYSRNSYRSRTPSRTYSLPSTSSRTTQSPVASTYTSPLSHTKSFLFSFDNVSLNSLKSINRIDIKVVY